MLWPCGMTVALAVDSTVCVCVPLTLFSNRSLTPIPPRDNAPCRVMVGPGELLQPEDEMEVWMFTGVEKLALTVVDAWAIEASPRLRRTTSAPTIFFMGFSHLILSRNISSNTFGRSARYHKTRQTTH